MLAVKTLMAIAALTAALPAMASKVALDFETLPNASRVGEAYKDKGIHFSSNAFNFLSSDGNCGGHAFFYDLTRTHALGCNSIQLSTGSPGGDASFYIKVDAGFTGLFSFEYVASGSNMTMNLYDTDLFLTDPKANTLGFSNLALPPLTLPPPCESNYSCVWDTHSVDLQTQKAKYVVFSGANGGLFLDNITFDNVNDTGGGTDVPEPGGVALSLAALGALAYARKRVQR